MKANIKAKFEIDNNRTVFKGYDVVVGNEVIAHFNSEYNAIVFIMDNADLRLT